MFGDPCCVLREMRSKLNAERSKVKGRKIQGFRDLGIEGIGKLKEERDSVTGYGMRVAGQGLKTGGHRRDRGKKKRVASCELRGLLHSHIISKMSILL